MTTRVHTVYALTEPNSTLIRYVGQTSQGAHKRWRDHISQTKFRLDSQEKKLTASMEWIAALLENDLEPGIVVFSTHRSKEEAEDVEQQLINILFPTGALLNDPINGNTRSGRPPGSMDSAETHLRKCVAWKHSREKRMEVLPKSNLTLRERTAQKKQAAGYPAPEHSVRHNLNWAHHLTRFPETRTNEVIRRELLGYPHPGLAQSHPLNASTRAGRRQGATLQQLQHKIALGYPEPTLPIRHPTNLAHNRKVRNANQHAKREAARNGL